MLIFVLVIMNKTKTKAYTTMKHILLFVLLALLCLVAGAQRRLGGDISLLPSYLSKGTEYRLPDGRKASPYQIFRQAGWNTMRVRLFVDPSHAPQGNKDEGVCQDLPYVVRLCRDIKQQGFGLMLDFHYSDTWADPAKQFMPRAWAKAIGGKSRQEQLRLLRDSVYAHTCRSLTELKRNGVVPDYIQVGNEITFGMLWPLAKTQPDSDRNWDALTALLRSGTSACRLVCPSAKIIIHTEHAQDWTATRQYYDRLRKAGTDYDIIGLSYYPMWHGTVAHLDGVLDSLKCFGKPVMIVETAFYYSHENDPWEKDPQHYSDLYPVSPKGQAMFTDDLVAMLASHPEVTGLFWWFPEENQSGRPVVKNWINRGLFSNHTGCALPALQVLKGFVQ